MTQQMHAERRCDNVVQREVLVPSPLAGVPEAGSRAVAADAAVPANVQAQPDEMDVPWHGYVFEPEDQAVDHWNGAIE
eukprot:5068854-Prymnesium_polylepis.1